RALRECVEHLRSSCELVTMFEGGAPAFYGPCTGAELGQAPSWWSHLTVERWADLLDEPSTDAGELAVACRNSLVSAVAGAVPIVRDQVDLELHPHGAAGPVEISIERRVVSARRGLHSDSVLVEQVGSWQDLNPPQHKAPLRYK